MWQSPANHIVQLTGCWTDGFDLMWHHCDVQRRFRWTASGLNKKLPQPQSNNLWPTQDHQKNTCSTSNAQCEDVSRCSSYLYNSISSRVCCLENVIHCPPLVQQVQSHSIEHVGGREEAQDFCFLFIIASIQRNQAHIGDFYADLRTQNQWWSEALQWRWLF